MIMDREVLAILTAILTAASIMAVIVLFHGVGHEPYESIALLNAQCQMGPYPSQAVVGGNVSLCLYVENHMYHVEYFKVVYKIGVNTTLPTNTTPSPEEPVMEWRLVLGHNDNVTFHVKVPFNPPKAYTSSDKVALIFELWRYEEPNGWTYTGRFVYIYVHPRISVIPGR